MDAKNILLLGLGQHKSKAVADLVEGPLSSFCPGSVLQYHENAIIVLDQLAASNLCWRFDHNHLDMAHQEFASL